MKTTKYLILLSMAALAGCSPKTGEKSNSSVSSQPSFKLTIVPYEAAEKLQEEYSPMAAYLAKAIGAPEGKYFHVTEYAGVATALKNSQVDVAYMSALPYAITSSKVKLNPLAQPWVKGKPTYHGVIFVRADSPIKTLADLKGKTFAFGDQLSTTGYLLPMILLEKSGVPLTSLKKYYNAGDAEVVVKAVENGTADAGAAYEVVMDVVYKKNPEKAKLFRMIGATEEIPNGIYVARGDMPTDQVEKLKKAFMDMNTDPVGKAAMLNAPNDKMIPADDAAFDGIRKAAIKLGLDLTHMKKK